MIHFLLSIIIIQKWKCFIKGDFTYTVMNWMQKRVQVIISIVLYSLYGVDQYDINFFITCVFFSLS